MDNRPDAGYKVENHAATAKSWLVPLVLAASAGVVTWTVRDEGRRSRAQVSEAVQKDLGHVVREGVEEMASQAQRLGHEAQINRRIDHVFDILRRRKPAQAPGEAEPKPADRDPPPPGAEGGAAPKDATSMASPAGRRAGLAEGNASPSLKTVSVR